MYYTTCCYLEGVLFAFIPWDSATMYVHHSILQPLYAFCNALCVSHLSRLSANQLLLVLAPVFLLTREAISSVRSLSVSCIAWDGQKEDRTYSLCWNTEETYLHQVSMVVDWNKFNVTCVSLCSRAPSMLQRTIMWTTTFDEHRNRTYYLSETRNHNMSK